MNLGFGVRIFESDRDTCDVIGVFLARLRAAARGVGRVDPPAQGSGRVTLRPIKRRDGAGERNEVTVKVQGRERFLFFSHH